MAASVALVQLGAAISLKHGAHVNGTFLLLFNPEAHIKVIMRNPPWLDLNLCLLSPNSLPFLKEACLPS